jgi:hypothetical protein
MKTIKFLKILVAVAATVSATSCVTTREYKSKGGMRETTSFTPLAGTGIYGFANVGGGGYSPPMYGGGCQPRGYNPGYGGGGGYQQRPPMYPPQYRRPPQQCGNGYQRGYNPGYGGRPPQYGDGYNNGGYNNGGGYHPSPRPPYMGSARNPISVGGPMFTVDFSDRNPGGIVRGR